MLDGDNPACRKAAAIAVARHFIDDRHARIAGAHEIAMQGMGDAGRVDRADGRYQRLADHLAAKHPLPADLRAGATKQIEFERLQIERFEQSLDAACHDLPPLSLLTQPVSIA